MTTPDRMIGLMSGTSLDGVDAVLATFEPQPSLLAAHHLEYPQSIKDRCLAMHRPGADDLDEAARLSNALAHLYAQAVRELLAKANLPAQNIRAVACHGQTVRHNPAAGYTIQLNNPSLLAELTKIRVIADLRSRDIAAGGQGAPMVPAFHEAMFRHPTRHRVVLNLGGIANLTDLASHRLTTGFDCGPANILMDAWIHHVSGLAFDSDGAWAATGHIDTSLLSRLLNHPFFSSTPPKSCGREEFNLTWLLSQLKPDMVAAEDVQATLLALTVRSCTDAIRRWCGIPDDLLVCGGGARNAQLLAALAREFPASRVAATDEFGIAADHVEAMAFAWLGYRTLNGLFGNLPSVTGALGPRVLGAIYPA